MTRVVILVNKDFEYAGFLEGLRDTIPVYAGTNGRQAECRFDNLIADIYCIQNLFGKDENSSNSEVKYGYLKELFASNAFRLSEIDTVLSVSTAESTPISQGEQNASMNGCVLVGNQCFLCDQSANDPTTESHLTIGDESNGYVETYMSTLINQRLYEKITAADMTFKKAPANTAVDLRCIAREDYLSVGVVNVMDYSRYEIADEAAYTKALRRASWSMNRPCCIETTHGVVMKALRDACVESKLWNIPVTFISPIVDRYLKFSEDVDGKYGKQNFVCSYNGGVATGHILTILDALK